MNKGIMVALCGAGFFVMMMIGVIMVMFNYNNVAVKMEQGIVAQYEQNQNNLSQYSNKIMEAAQVPSMYRDDYSKVLKDAILGTYGKDGAQAAFLWLKERNIDFDSSLYTKIQSMIEAGRDKFEDEQKMLIDKKRQYETRLKTMPGSFVLSVMGFPKIQLDQYKIVKSDYSNDAFEKGVENGLKLK